MGGAGAAVLGIGGSGNVGGGDISQFPASEYCDKIKYEFEYLQTQHNVMKLELDRFRAEKNELQQQSRNYFETAYFLNVQLHKQAEINSRFLTLLGGVLKLLPPETQKQLSDEIDSAKRVSVADIERRIRNQQISTDPFLPDIVPDSGRQPIPNNEDDGLQNQNPNPTDATTEFGNNTTITTSTTTTTTSRKKQKRENSVSNQQTPMEDIETDVHADDDAHLSIEVDEQSDDENVSVPQVAENKVDSVAEAASRSGNAKAASSSASQSKQQNTPKQVRSLAVLPHNHSVSAITFGDDGTRVYTGGRGVVRVWSTTGLETNTHHNGGSSSGNATSKAQSCEKVTEMNVLKDAYIRSCKLTRDSQSMVICGETREIVIWDLAANVNKHTMETSVSYHYALILSPDSRHCFSCFSDGNIGMWDLHSGTLVRRFAGHSDSVSCIDITPDGKTLVTGSLDKTLRTWDWGTGKQMSMHTFPGQIFTLGVCPTVSQSQTPNETWAAVGLEDSNVEVVDLKNTKNNYQLHLHESCVLSLKFAPNGQWFVTGGKDKLLNVWKAPYGPGIVQTREPNSILCCDISPTHQFIGTGSWERMATLYQVLY